MALIQNRRIKVALTIFLICGLLEIFLFNIRSFELIGSNSQKRISVSKSEMEFSDLGGEKKLVLTIHKDQGIPDDLRNFEIQLENVLQDRIRGTVHTTEVGFTAGHTRKIEMIPGIEHSRFIFLYPSKNVSEITLTLENLEPQAISLVINSPVPFHFKFYRFSILILIVSVIYCFRPGSFLHQTRLHLKERCQRRWLFGIFLYFTGTFLFVSVSTYPNLKTMIHSDNFAFWNKDHYQLLTEALSHRSLSLLAEPPEILKTLQNPYDAAERAANQISDADIYWDTAYYEGKYYVYFGVIPVVTLLLPYKLITGHYLLNDFAVLFYAILGSFGLAYCLFWITRRFFNHLSAATFLIGLIFLVQSTGLIWCIRRPLSYELAMVSAFCFSVCGFALNLSAVSNETHRNLKLAFGCLFMACAVGCRPISIFASLLNIPILLPLIFSKKENRRLHLQIQPFFAVIIPYLIIGLFLMIYNQLRFGSVFEFGQNYQLTIVDNRAALNGLTVPNYLLGIFNLVFRPGIQFSTDFPFLVAPEPLTFGFAGTKYWKNCFSAASICPFIFLLLLVPYYPLIKRTRDRLFSALLAGLILIPLFIAGYVGSSVGTYQRYMMDFSWMIVLAGMTAAFLAVEKLQEIHLEKFSQAVLLICLLINTGFYIALSCGEAQLDVSNFFEYHNPILFQKIAYAFMFWL